MQPRLRAALLSSILTLSLMAGCKGEQAADRDAEVAEPSAPSRPQPASDAPRLVILISIDTLRADHLGFHGYARPTSPHLDAFAAEGVVFEDASSTTSWTLPSHASMLTGLYPLRHRVRSHHRAMPESVPTLAATLAAQGWRTAAVVNSTYLQRGSWGLMRGFEDYFWVEETVERVSPSTLVTDRALRWIGETEPRPTFLFVHYMDVHSDYTSLPEYEDLLVEPYSGIADGTTSQMILSILDDNFLENCRSHFDRERCTLKEGLVLNADTQKIQFDDRDIEHLVQRYDAGIRQMDAELARFFEQLDAQGHLSQAVIFITSDHGEEFEEHGRLQHAITQYQEMLHVPLVVRGPGVPPGVRVSTPVSIVDLAPTILGLAGVEVDHSFDGVDLAPLWQGKPIDGIEERWLYGEAPGWTTGSSGNHVYRSIREGRFKLQYESYRGIYALYDLASDPREQTDIAEREPEITGRLLQAMKARYQNLEPDAPDLEIDSEDAERLRALGYIHVR